MSLVLLCKDNKVLDIETMKVINYNLLPGLLFKNQSKHLFMDWFHKRYSERSNTASRKLRGILFGQGNREVIDKTTHALSLSDCYWINDAESETSFNDISPYYNSFWMGEGQYEGGSIPTLYVNGYLTKYWQDKNTLVKNSDKREILCAKVAEGLGISTVNVFEYQNGIAVNNFTSDKIMFESAEASGRIDPENFTVNDVLDVFGTDGFDMIFLDALIGNGDRHAGNFGFLRNADTGEYIKMAPLFDYDHAYDSKSSNDIMIKELKSFSNGIYKNRYDELIKRANELAVLDGYMKERLLNMGV